MNNVWTVALRPVCSSLRASPRTTGEQSWRRAFSASAYPRHSLFGNTQRRFQDSRHTRPPLNQGESTARCRRFSTTVPSFFSKVNTFNKLVPYTLKQVDQGLSFRHTNLTARELAEIFSQRVGSTSFANRLLRVLHARRVDGTLDLDLPNDITKGLQSFPNATEKALHWLRQNYPIDEDAAILDRIEREEGEAPKESPAQLMQRAEQMGIYKPQSGQYAAKLGQEGDIFGESELDKIRAENVARAEKEEEDLEAQINKLQEEVKEKVGELQVQPENAIEGIIDLVFEVRILSMDRSFHRSTSTQQLREMAAEAQDSRRIQAHARVSRDNVEEQGLFSVNPPPTANHV